VFFSFPLRGRKAKIISPTWYDDTLFGDRQLCTIAFSCSKIASTFPLPSSQRQRKKLITLRPLRL
jgi:hypothetical protein